MGAEIGLNTIFYTTLTSSSINENLASKLILQESRIFIGLFNSQAQTRDGQAMLRNYFDYFFGRFINLPQDSSVEVGSFGSKFQRWRRFSRILLTF